MLSDMHANSLHRPLAEEVIRRHLIMPPFIVERGRLKFPAEVAQAIIAFAATLHEDRLDSLSELELSNVRPDIVRAGYQALGIKPGAKDSRQRAVNMAAVGLALVIADRLNVRYRY